MADFLLSLPDWIVWIGVCSITALALLPEWYISRNRLRERSLRLETMIWRADKLLQSTEPLNLQISELNNKALTLDFSNERIFYRGKKIQWQVTFKEIRSWRIYDVNVWSTSVASKKRSAVWSAEFKDSKNAYTLDGSFIKNSESLELLKAACVCALGSNSQTRLEGLRVELARSERILHEINSGNINMRR